MPHDLEAPSADGEKPEWDSLYRALGVDVARHRPVFTGDVFEKVDVQSIGETKRKTVMLVQHPCALRVNGVDLSPRLLVVEVRQHPLVPILDWLKHLSKMPLPHLYPQVESGKRNQAAFFDSVYLASPLQLDIDKRIACLSEIGVNLLLQRWVNHNSRTVVPTATYQKAVAPVFEEADILEDWCLDRVAAGKRTILEATQEALDILREDLGEGRTLQRMLEDPQTRSHVRREMARRRSNM